MILTIEVALAMKVSMRHCLEPKLKLLFSSV
ncbi:MAG: hypothetical protein PWP56_544 [Acetobacterium sp.]|jgi:hypothetical protein|nr:hypothetical protein [Acetobacterium sp.]